jgi:uncharacterized protein DUF4386
MSARLVGVLLLLVGLCFLLGLALSDPQIETHGDRSEFIQQVEDVADRVPAIFAFQVLDVIGGLLAVFAAIGLYGMLRDQARVDAVAGLSLIVIMAVFTAGRSFVGGAMTVAAEDYAGADLEGLAKGSNELLETINVLSALHFGYFLAAFATLGLGVAAFSYGMRSVGAAPRWLSSLGLASGILVCLTPLALVSDGLFIPFFLGTLLALVWLIGAGLWFMLRGDRLQAVGR